jgi:hypothetical protein
MGTPTDRGVGTEVMQVTATVTCYNTACLPATAKPASGLLGQHIALRIMVLNSMCQSPGCTASAFTWRFVAAALLNSDLRSTSEYLLS